MSCTKREELMTYEADILLEGNGCDSVYLAGDADEVMDSLEYDIHIYQDIVAKAEARIKELNEVIIAKDMAGAELYNENKALRHNLEDWKAENEALKCKIEEIQNEDVLKDTVRVTLSNENQTLKEKIKELEADKLRQENYYESLVNENKRISEKLETRIAMWEHEKNLRKDIANDWAKAQDRIKELEEVVSKMEKSQPKWISVKDRLPSDGEVLICFGEEDIAMCDWNYITNYNGVTHWMPLPSSPRVSTSDTKSED